MLLGVNGMTMRDIASVVVEYLSTLSNGTGISTSEAIDKIFGIEYLAGGNYRISDKVISCTEFFDLNDAVHNIAKQKGVILDTSHNAGGYSVMRKLFSCYLCGLVFILFDFVCKIYNLIKHFGNHCNSSFSSIVVRNDVSD